MDSIFQGSQAYHGCDSLACRHADLFKVHRRECWASLARTSDGGAESGHLGSVTCGFRRPISSFGGHMINTRCSCHYDSLLSKILDSLQLCSAKSIEEHFLSPILLRQRHHISNFTACPSKTNSRLPFQQDQPRCLSTM
jgi:hypothetical protein